jgi:hypothetical protein
MLDREALEKVLGGHARPTMKQPVKVRPAQVAGRGEFVQERLPGMICVQVTNHGRNAIEVVHADSIREIPG